LLRWLGATEKTGWDWIELSLKLSVPLTIAILGSYLGYQNNERQMLIAGENLKQQNRIADSNQRDSVLRDYLKEMKGILLAENLSTNVSTPGSPSHGVAKALTVTAISQLAGTNSKTYTLDSLDHRYTPRQALQTAALLGSHYRLSHVFLFIKESGVPILKGVELISYNLSGVNFAGVNLRESVLTKTFFVNAILDETDLSGATLFAANFSGAIMNGVNLSGADLELADFGDAQLHHANLRNANLRRADLSNVHNLWYADFAGIQWDGETRWPSSDKFRYAKNIPSALQEKLGISRYP
jgi:uncharacterized protein YjbI with pentapeptide repeats